MTTSSLAYRVREAASSLRGRLSVVPRVGIILGSGLGPLADEVENPGRRAVRRDPALRRFHRLGHAGQLVGGMLEGVPVAVMRGRVHFYEGYSLQQITFPVRTLHRLGAEILVITNAAGGLNLTYRPGDLMALKDHINLPGLAGMNPLVGADEPELGVRFLDMTDQYDEPLRARALEIGADLGVPIHEGVYVVWPARASRPGPSCAPAPDRRRRRRDVHRPRGHRRAPRADGVLGISVITNTADPDAVVADVSHAGVLNVAERAASGLAAIVRGVLRTLDGGPPDDGA